MQLISESYDILKRGLGMKEAEIADGSSLQLPSLRGLLTDGLCLAVFATWNKGVLDSFLIEITIDILRFNDDDGVPLVTKILDSASQKGTGKWTAINALDLGMPVTLIGEAVFARCLSSIKAERTRASKVLGGPQIEAFTGDKKQFIDDLEQALYASKLCVPFAAPRHGGGATKADRLHVQRLVLPGLHAHARGRRRVQVEPQLRRHRAHVAWRMHHQEVRRARSVPDTSARVDSFPASVFLGDITTAYEKNPKLENLLFDDFFNKASASRLPFCLRKAIR